ncbi:MAG: helix-turn-helix transcriptional regulator [Tenacibaculum sp.]
MLKNVAESAFTEVRFEKGFSVLIFYNSKQYIEYYKRDVDSSFIQIHYCVEGSCKFHFNNKAYTFTVLDKHSVLMYNPQQKLPINMEILPKTRVISILISIKIFHFLFSKEAGYIPFLSDDNINRKYYDNTPIKNEVLEVLEQIFSINLHDSVKDLYLRGKTYELLSLHFNSNENSNDKNCPFLVDDKEILKIRNAKDLIILKMSEPPSLQDLANSVGLNIRKLKEGFKQIYGDTVYSFLFNYKMEHARKMLETKQFNVNEVGLQIGYSTSSHFIVAFKKKFGVTPKQYTISLDK